MSIDHLRLRAILAAVLLVAGFSLQPAAQSALSDKPETPFKLATFEAAGKLRIGMVLGSRVLDIGDANAHVTKQARLAAMPMPSEMRALIEQYATLSPRLYQIANYFKANPTTALPFAFDFDKVAVKAPIKYPWNMLAAAANYKAHAEGMGNVGTAPAAPSAPPPPAANGFDPTAAARIVPDRDAPIMFAKSPRSNIIDPNEPFYIVDGRTRTDYEGEMAIVMGPRPAYRIPKERAHDYVFGYSIVQDVSDRGSERLREVSMFAGTNWFDGKSIDGAAPFGPVIVPKEFLPNAPGHLKISTKVNGVVKQDSNTDQLIWDEAHLVAYLTSRLTLYPGDVIVTGTPAGTGMERGTFLKPGDVVSIEVEGIGTLTTPFKALSERNSGGPRDEFEPGLFTSSSGARLPYRLLRPDHPRDGAKYPLVVQLHGSGAIGTDNKGQIGAFSNGWLLPEIRDKYAAFVLVPQFPARTVEYAEVSDPAMMRSKPTALLASVYQLIDKVVTDFPIDRSRIYVVGFSMGASSALQALIARPDLFAAAMADAPVPPDSSVVPATPILILHGDADTENPFAASHAWSEAIKLKGARELEFRAYPGLQHELPPNLPAETWWRDWLFSKKRLPSKQPAN